MVKRIHKGLGVLLALSVLLSCLPQISPAAAGALSDAAATAQRAVAEMTLHSDTDAADLVDAVTEALADSSIAVDGGGLQVTAGGADATGAVTGALTLTRDGASESVAVNVTLPQTGDLLGAVSLMSAARKNHYIRATDSGADLSCEAEPATRRFVRMAGLADASGVSFRLVGTERYLQTSGDKLIVAAAESDPQKQAATFYPQAGEKPVWAEVYEGFFEQYATYADRSRFIVADVATNSLSIGAVDEGNRLAASFKKTGDNTDVLPDLRGAVYYPSYSYNGAQFFKFYDSAIIERDMQYAQSLGINAFRIWVSYEYWLEDATHFEKAYNDFLRLADKYGIKILVSLFEGCSSVNDYNDRYYGRSYSVTSPAGEIFNDQSRWGEPKAFIDWFMARYKDDRRQLAIEVYNEPWGSAREQLAAELLKYTVSKQGKVAISLGTAPAEGLHSIAYSVQEGVDIIQYHANFPANTTNFTNNANNKMRDANRYNLPLYCTEVQWVGGPGNPYDSHYENLAPTCEALRATGKWAPFYWTLMMHPCYLPENRHFKLTNGIFQEDGSVWSIASAAAIAPEKDTSGLVENKTDPYTQYLYAHLYSENFMDNHGYKWTLGDGFSVADEALTGTGTALADLTDFSNFVATVSVRGVNAGLLFRAKDADNGLYVKLSADALSICKRVDGVETTLAEAPCTPQAVNTLQVTANGEALTAELGEVSVSATDSSFASGLIGLTASEQTTFDDLLVSAAAVEAPVPAAPTWVGAVRLAQGALVCWNPVFGAESYTVLRAADGEAAFEPVATGLTVPRFTDASADPQTRFSYAVVAVNANGASIRSTPAVCAPSPTAGTALSLPEVTRANALLWYTFDTEDESSTEAVSSVVTGKSVSLSGRFLPTGGASGGGFWFDGVDDQIQLNAADTTTGVLHDGYSRRTFTFLMCPYSLDGKQMLLKTGGDLNGIAVRIRDGALEVAVATGAVDADTQYLTDPFPLSEAYLNRWTRVTVVFNSGTVSLYLDADKVREGRAKATRLSAATRASYLGSCGDMVSAFRDEQEGQYFNGLLDDFRVYKSAVVPTLPTDDPTPSDPTPSDPTPSNPTPTPTTVAVRSVGLSRTRATLAVKGTLRLSATVAPANATEKTVRWTSDDPKVAAVSASGVVTAKAAGKATVTATAGGKTARCVVTVKPAKIKQPKLTKRGKKLTLRFKKGAGANYYRVVVYRNGKKLKTAAKVRKTKYTYTAKKKGKYRMRVYACAKVGKTVYTSAAVKSKTLRLR